MGSWLIFAKHKQNKRVYVWCILCSLLNNDTELNFHKINDTSDYETLLAVYIKYNVSASLRGAH